MGRVVLNLFVILVFLISWKFVVLSRPNKVNTLGIVTSDNTNPKHMHILIKGRAKGSKVYPHRRKGGDPGNNYYHKHLSNIKPIAPFQLVTTADTENIKEVSNSTKLHGSMMPLIIALGTNEKHVQKSIDSAKSTKKIIKIAKVTNKMSFEKLILTTPYTKPISNYTIQLLTSGTKVKVASKSIGTTKEMTGKTITQKPENGKTANKIVKTKSTEVTEAKELDDDITDTTKVLTESTESIIIEELGNEDDTENTKLLTKSTEMIITQEPDDDILENVNVEITSKNSDVTIAEELEDDEQENTLKKANTEITTTQEPYDGITEKIKINTKEADAAISEESDYNEAENSNLITTNTEINTITATLYHTTRVSNRMNTKLKNVDKPLDTTTKQKNKKKTKKITTEKPNDKTQSAKKNTKKTKTTDIQEAEDDTTQSIKKNTKKTEATDIKEADDDRTQSTKKNTKKTEATDIEEADDDTEDNTQRNTRNTEIEITQQKTNRKSTEHVHTSQYTSKVFSRNNLQKNIVQKAVDEETGETTPKLICRPVQVTVATEKTTTEKSTTNVETTCKEISSSPEEIIPYSEHVVSIDTESAPRKPEFPCEPDDLNAILNNGPPPSFTPKVNLNFGSEIPINCSDIEALMNFQKRNLSRKFD